MTREEKLDWLYRLRGEIDVYMPKEWIIPMNNALDAAIKSLKQEPCEDAELKDIFCMGCEYKEQEPKTGHWIWCVGSHKCSNCEEYTCFSHKTPLRYCPNCGAKMIDPQESEDKE